LRPTVIVAVFLLVSSGCGPSESVGVEDEQGTDQEASIGLWVIPGSQIQAANARTKEVDGALVVYSPPSAFYFHGDSATMHLICLKAWMWHTEDDYYRVKTKWVGDDLYWLPPFGDWSKKATFRNGRFEVDGEDVVWKYERVSPKDAVDECRPLLKKRELHDYAINPYRPLELDK
jgi:hypothetical protein